MLNPGSSSSSGGGGGGGAAASSSTVVRAFYPLPPLRDHIVTRAPVLRISPYANMASPAAQAAAIARLQVLAAAQCALDGGGSLSDPDSPPESIASSSAAGRELEIRCEAELHVKELLKAPTQAHTELEKLNRGSPPICDADKELAAARARAIKSPESAFAEVAEIKMIVYQLLLAPTNGPLAGISALLHQANLEGGNSPPSHNNNNGMNGVSAASSRKRSAHFGGGGGPSQPEQPVALRPAISNCGLPSAFMPQWSSSGAGQSPWQNLFAQTLRTSPTLPGAAPTTETASAAGDNKLWSSPSSVESGIKPESNAGDSNIDPVGMESDGSPTSSTCTQSPADVLAFAAAAAHNSSMSAHANGQLHERKPRKQISDDYVKLIRQQHELSGKNISDIQIPVPEALECDPTFTAVSEQQIVQQVVQAKKFDEMSPKDVQEATTQLCKKLAEKRVFGPRLMAQTTVAGPNHSTYNNLPDEGIIYIQHVCRTVLKDKLKSEEEFWDVFREAMRKLAARCRRVRHAKKTKSLKENGQTPLLQNDLPLAFLSQAGATEQWAEAIKARAVSSLVTAANAASSSSSPPSDLLAQLQAALPRGQSINGVLIKSESPELTPFALLKNDAVAEWADEIRMRAAAATSPLLPMHSELSAQIANALPASLQAFEA